MRNIDDTRWNAGNVETVATFADTKNSRPPNFGKLAVFRVMEKARGNYFA